MFISIESLKNLDDIRYIPTNKKYVCLFSGGKDSGLALSLAQKCSEAMALITCCDSNQSLFHQHDKDIVKLQGEALGIPVVFVEGHWKESKQLIIELKKAKENGAEFVLFGDIADIKNANRKIKICNSVGLRACMPLWGISYNELILSLTEHKIRSLITVTRPIVYQFTGKIFNKETYDLFSNMNINPFGEEGEFHSTLIDADIFKFPINYKFNKYVEVRDKFGQKRISDYLYFKGDKK